MMDRVSSQYGWSDDYILSLRYARLKEICEVIDARRKEEVVTYHSYAQLFFSLISSFGSWEGRPPRLPDLFGQEKLPAPQAAEQFRTDAWWQLNDN